MSFNNNVNNTPESLDTVCAALAYAMGIEPPEHAAEKNRALSDYIDKVFGGEKADRVVMFNPDAVARWIYEKYPEDIDIPHLYKGYPKEC